jgi:hypothetical protein
MSEEQKKRCDEYWPVMTYIHEEACKIQECYNKDSGLWIAAKKLAEEAFMLGRYVGRQEVKEAENCVKCGEYIKEVDRFDGTCIDCYEAAKNRRAA